MSDGLVGAWRINQEMNRMLLECLPDEALLDRCSPKTRTVASQFAHLHNVRVLHLKKRAKHLVGELTSFGRGAQPDREELTGALDPSGEAIATMLTEGEAAGKIKSWPPGPPSFLGYLCAHEAHHRALAIVSLRLSGRRLPDQVKYGIWYWSRKPTTAD